MKEIKNLENSVNLKSITKTNLSIRENKSQEH